MNIALLNVRITVQKSIVANDRYGNHVNTWEPYLSCYATVGGETPKQESEAGQTVDDGRADFTIRYCKAAAVINATGYRVLLDDEVFDILGVNHMNYKGKGIKLLCRKARR